MWLYEIDNSEIKDEEHINQLLVWHFLYLLHQGYYLQFGRIKICKNSKTFVIAVFLRKCVERENTFFSLMERNTVVLCLKTFTLKANKFWFDFDSFQKKRVGAHHRHQPVNPVGQTHPQMVGLRTLLIRKPKIHAKNSLFLRRFRFKVSYWRIGKATTSLFRGGLGVFTVPSEENFGAKFSFPFSTPFSWKNM